MYLFDTHVHTSQVSFCGQVPGEEMVKLYVKAGYSGFVMTDHYNKNTMEKRGATNDAERFETFLKGYRAAKAYADTVGFDVLFGMELALTGSWNEYLIYGMTEELFACNTEIYDFDMTALRRFANEHDLLIMQAHPYRPGMTRGVPGFLDGVEVVNGNPRHNSQNDLSLMYANQHGLLMSSGSDAHQIEDVGMGGLRTAERIANLDMLKKVLREGSAELVNNLGR